MSNVAKLMRFLRSMYQKSANRHCAARLRLKLQGHSEAATKPQRMTPYVQDKVMLEQLALSWRQKLSN